MFDHVIQHDEVKCPRSPRKLLSGCELEFDAHSSVESLDGLAISGNFVPVVAQVVISGALIPEGRKCRRLFAGSAAKIQYSCGCHCRQVAQDCLRGIHASWYQALKTIRKWKVVADKIHRLRDIGG